MPPPPPSAPPGSAPHGALRMCLHLLAMPALILALLALVLALAAGTARWLLLSEGGTRWLLAHVPGVEARGVSGALLGAQWRAERLHLQWADGKRSITFEGLSAEGLQWKWKPTDLAWVGLVVQRLDVQRVVLVSGASGGPPPALPGDLALPLQLSLAQGRVERLEIDQHAPLLRLTVADLHIDPSPGTAHSVGQVRAEWQGTQIVANARIFHAAPLVVDAQATLQPVQGGDAPAWAAVLRASGPLAQLAVNGTLRGVPRARREAPALDLRAVLRPFNNWPVDALNLSTRALDLSALHAKAPQTRLSASVQVTAPDRKAPLSAVIAIDNAEPGRWDERRLPLRRLSVDLQGHLDRRDEIELRQFDVEFADATRPAGRWTGSGSWRGTVMTLKTRLDDVSPRRVDGRAAAMQLSGPLEATLHGLPSPDALASAPGGEPRIEWRLDLEGKLDAAPQPVRLSMEGSADDRRLELKNVQASTGAASATLSGLLQRAGRGDWKIETTGSLVDFDPQPWWPGEAGSAWRQGRHRLSAQWQIDLRLPGDADSLPPLALAQRLVGNGTLRVRDSALAGVPLAADLSIGYTQAAAPTPASLRVDLQLGGNQLSVEGRGDPTGPGGADRLRIDLKADALSALAPLARLHPLLAAWVPRQGGANAAITAEGRWPALRSEGNASVTQLLAGPLSLARGQASWRLDSTGAQPMALLIDIAGVQFGSQRADSLRAELRGTLADHRLELAGALPLLPPELAVQLLGVQSQSGTRGQLLAQGGWLADAAGGGRWRARIERLSIGSWDGGAGAGASASNWAQARDLRAELQFGADGSLTTLQAEAGRVQLADAVTLRWDDVRLDLRGERTQLELRADIEPFALAPLLARVQPDMGWQGDLRVAARVNIRAGERFDADLSFERHDGDLHVSTADTLQLLGLTDLRLAIGVHDGQWIFSPLFRGRSLGEISGSLRVLSTPQQRWPQAADRIEGDVQARVADIGIWRAWIPPGWHLGGELRTTAALSGSFGAPRYSGTLSGSRLGVRNLLEGVNVTDGDVSVRLDGDTAQIERFKLRGGDGSLSITGGATLGATPQARLQVKAERFRVLGRVDRMLIASGTAELQLSSEAGRLDGSFTVDEGLFDAGRSSAPTLDEDVTVRRAAVAEDVGAQPIAPRKRRNFTLGVNVDLGDELHVRGRGLDTVLRGQVRLTAPEGQLAVNGTIRAERGTYAAYSQKLEIERGILAFSGPPGNPRLDVLALRPNLDTRVGVLISGNVLTPRVRLYSEPEMSDTDKLAWLMLGRAPDGLGRSDTALLQRAAVALIAGEGEAPTDALLRNLGLDELSLRQSEGDVRETVITLGKQLSRRWYVGYERGVNATNGTWQLIYRIAQRFTLRLQSGLENSLDVIWVLRLGEAAGVPAAPTAPAAPAASAPTSAPTSAPAR